MKSLSLVLYTHQPVIFKDYRFFEIGKDHNYFNTFLNTEAIKQFEAKSFKPLNKLLLEFFQRTDLGFKVSFSFSGTTLDLLEISSPTIIKELKKMNDLGNVEFLSQTYSHSILSQKYQYEFMQQTMAQKQKVFNLFGQIPRTFLNISAYPHSFLCRVLPEMGFKIWIQPKKMEDKILATLKPNIFEAESLKPVRILVADNLFAFKLSEPKKQAKNHGDYTTNMLDWVEKACTENNLLCLLIDCMDLVKENPKSELFLRFMKKLPDLMKEKGIDFFTPSELQLDGRFKTISFAKWNYDFPLPEKTPTPNQLQAEILELMDSLMDNIYQTDSKEIIKTWFYLQDEWNFRQLESGTPTEVGVNPDKAVKSYINFRNILEDFSQRVEQQMLSNKAKNKIRYQISDPQHPVQTNPPQQNNFMRLF
ncbi:alpha-glycosidase [Cecembia calidifontis]|jgi:alpha-amylase|uniref:Glycosyl hydrolase family 57 n=1 Tax=Cecembia calidifontis TaxID=1187080 RepID=A0A4Q7PAR2_9BACT|nr:alpha-glycosidase [Cecembia calidifontis]RZS97275.1 glycosyl hydrolase family 57 [Cecembia calidifontis]